MVTTYVLDDNDRVRQVLVDLINAAEGFVVVGSSGSAEVALAEIERLRPGVAVVDDADDLGVCRALRTIAPDVACVVVAAGIEAWGAAEAVAAGAAGYVLKQPRSFRLLEALGEVAAGARLP